MGLASPRYIAAALTQLQAMATATAIGEWQERTGHSISELTASHVKKLYGTHVLIGLSEDKVLWYGNRLPLALIAF